MKEIFLLFLLPLLLVFPQCKNAGRAWNDSTQQIPGKIQCEFYDQGGEGIAYHDTDSINNGSGKLNSLYTER
jgi:hypothetical protein